MRIEKTDPRWFLAQGAAKDLLTAGLLPDELAVATINGQLSIFVEVIDDRMRNFPGGFFFYRWPNSFEPIATFSIFWRKSKTRRVYISLNDPRIEYLLGQTCLIVQIEPFSKAIIDMFEIPAGEFDPPGELENYEKEKMLYVGDLEAAKHFVYWSPNKPGEDASPVDRLRASFIRGLHDKVTNAIRCIAENDLRETIPAEAERTMSTRHRLLHTPASWTRPWRLTLLSTVLFLHCRPRVGHDCF